MSKRIALRDMNLPDLVARLRAACTDLWATCQRLVPLLEGTVPPDSLPPAQPFAGLLDLEDTAEEVVATARWVGKVHTFATALDRAEALRAHRQVRRCHRAYERLEGTLLGGDAAAIPF
jgi:hypothetical protein